ncbi:MAG: hypothetical protein ACLFV5_03610 [Anaerolineales bacterium]
MSESVHRVYQITVLVLLAFLVTGVLVKASPVKDGTEPVHLASVPGLDARPQIATRADGSVVVIWMEREQGSDDGSVLYAAQSPHWRPTSITSLPSSQRQYTIAVTADENVHIAYSQTMTQTQRIWHHVLGEEKTKDPWEVPDHTQSAFAVDVAGCLHYAWIQDKAIHYINRAQTMTVTLDIDPSETTSDLMLGTDGSGNAHVAWRGSDVTEGTSRIYYAPLATDTAPVPVAQGTGPPKLAVEASGIAHLCWHNENGLHYADSRDWSEIELVDNHVTSQDTCNLVAGPGQEAHLLWTAGGMLWYAHPVDWNASRRQISFPTTMGDFETAVDDRGSPHLIWATSENDADWDILYQSVFSISPKMVVRYPQGGEFLTHDTWAKAEIIGDAADILRVEFYLQVDDPLDNAPYRTSHTLRELGIDREARDGWAVPLNIAHLKTTERYRIMALATNAQGETIQARGDWFRTQPPDDACTTLRLPATEPVRGQGYIEALIHCQRSSYQRLHLYLTPAAAATETRIPLPDTLQYVGSYTYPGQQAMSPPLPWRLSYDSSRFPDGRYVAMAIAEDDAGHRTYLWPTDPFIIDNVMAPDLEITRPRSGAAITEDELRVSAIADDVDGTIEQIDFYLEQRHPLTQEYEKNASSLEQRHLFWLGQDTDSTDGWNLRVPIDPAWQGEHCRIWATALDDRGMQKSAYSGTFSLLGNEHPQIRLLRPVPDHPLRDTVTIRVSIRHGTGRIREPQVYLQNRDGSLTLLGPLEERENYLVHEWDTRESPNGPCRLLVVTQNEEGHAFSANSDEFLVDNGPPLYRFAAPTSGQEVSETIRVALESTVDPAPLDKVSLYYRDERGELYPIAEGHDIQTHWETTWNTRTAPDATCCLVALLTDAEGNTLRLEREVMVRNTTPRVDFVSLPTEHEWQGSQLIRWQAHHPLGTPLSTSLEYSPDGGKSWSEIASGIRAENSYRWDTTSVYDSRQGRLRVSVSDGIHYSQATSEIFVLNNVNEDPEITLLAPKPGTMDKGETQIAWQAWDPDTDPITVSLAYRRGEDSWTPIASNLTSIEKYLWDTSQLPAHDDYALRVTARDPFDATATDIIENLELVDNTAPSIRLLWPNARTHLEDKTTILWSARDVDEDPLAIDIYYSDNAGQSWIPLAEGIPNTGFYEWQVSYLPSGARYRVRVVARDEHSQASDESEDVFTIGRNLHPHITLLSPTATQTVSGIQPIRWAAFDPEGASLQISVTIRHTGAERWESLGTSSLNNGLLLWDTTDFPDGEYDLHAVATNGQFSASARLTHPISISNEKSQAPQVRLISPQGGEIWSGMQEVFWEAWDSDGGPITATLSMRAMDESDWDPLAVVNSRIGYHVWDTSRISPGDGYMLRVVAQTPNLSARDMTSNPVYLTNRDSHPPHVRILSPDAMNLAQNNIIAWTADDPDGDSLALDLSIRDENDGAWQELATGLYNGGEYVLDFPLHSERSYQIRAVASDAIYSSEALSLSFGTSVSVKQVPDLTLDIPADRGVWSGTEEIRWRATDPSRQDLTVKIDLSRDGGETWNTLERRLEDTGSYMWDTTAYANGPCLLRLTADNGYFDTFRISHPFTLSNPGAAPPTVSLLSPRRGETWSGIQEIRWSAQDKDGDELKIDLAYKVAGDSTWQTIARAIPDTGRYIWDTSGIPNCDCLRIRVTASDGRFLAQDEMDIPFAMNNAHTPLIKLIIPHGGEKWSGKQKIRWITAQETRMTRVTIQLSTNAGEQWETLASDLPPTGTYLWDTTTLPARSTVWIRVIAEEYTQKAVDMSSKPVIVHNGAQKRPLPFYLK